MKLPLHTAVFAATAILPGLADIQAIAANPELTILCPKLDGKSIANSAGAKYSVSCDWTIEAEGKAAKVDGKTTPMICMEACDESEDCYSVNMEADGGCSLISGKEKGMRSSTGFINLFRLPQATSTTAPVQITTTRGTTISKAVSETFTPRPITATVSASPATSAAPAAPAAPADADTCDLSLTNLCPVCDNTIAADASGNSYQIFCESSLFTNATYSVQKYLSVEGCMNQCDTLSWCLGASYYDDRNCEIASGPVVYVQPEAGYTAFLPVRASEATATAVPRVSARSISTTTSLAPDSTVTVLPIDGLCNTSALTCPACDGIIVEDALNQTYTALCTFAPVCDRLAFATGPLMQDECMQGCDQDGTCLAVLWYTDRNACQFCQQGLDGGPGSDLNFVLLVADIDGDDDNPESVSYSTTASSNWTSTTYYPPTTSSNWNSTTSSDWTSTTSYPKTMSGNWTSTTSYRTTAYTSKSSLTTTSIPASYMPPSYPVGSLRAPAPYSSTFARSTTTSSTYSTPMSSTTPYSSPTRASPNTTHSAAVPNISAVVCPGLDSGVFMDSTDSQLFDVKCDGIITAAQSRFTTASDFAACVASCGGDCDGVQFGYTSRCGLYQDISSVGQGTGWTVATSLSYPSSTQVLVSTAAS